MRGSVISKREPFSGRYFGIFHVEGDDPEPVAMFRSRMSADIHLEACRGLPSDNDEHFNESYQVFPLDAVGAWWNSYDTDPRADSPLTPEETIAAYQSERMAP